MYLTLLKFWNFELWKLKFEFCTCDELSCGNLEFGNLKIGNLETSKIKKSEIGNLINWKIENWQFDFFQVRESPAHVNIPTPTHAPDKRLFCCRLVVFLHALAATRWGSLWMDCQGEGATLRHPGCSTNLPPIGRPQNHSKPDPHPATSGQLIVEKQPTWGLL